MAKFIYQSKKIQKKNDPLPFPQKKKKTPKRMKYFVNVIILVKFKKKKNQVLSGSFDDLLMSSDHD